MLKDFISPVDIKLNLESTEKEECLAELLEVIVARQPSISRRDAMAALVEREEKSTTAVLPGIAIPHAICKSVKKSAIALGISKKEIDFDKPVNIVFELLFEENDVGFHMNILKSIVQLCESKTFKNRIMNAKSSQEVFDIIYEIESTEI